MKLAKSALNFQLEIKVEPSCSFHQETCSFSLLKTFYLLDLFILCVMFGQHEGLCTTYIPGATGGWERAPDALEMEL